MVESINPEVAPEAQASSSPLVRRVVFTLWLVGFWALATTAQNVIETGNVLGKGKFLNSMLGPIIEGAKLAQNFCLIAAITLTATHRQKLACMIGALALVTSLLIYRLAQRGQEGGLWPISVTQVVIFLAFCGYYRFARLPSQPPKTGLVYQLKIADLFILTLAIALLLNVLRFRMNSLRRIFLADLELIGFYPRIVLNVAIIGAIFAVAGLCLVHWVSPRNTNSRTLLTLAAATITGALACAAVQFAIFYALYPATRGSSADQLAQCGHNLVIALSFCGWLALSIMLFRLYGLLPPTRPVRAF